MLTELSQIYFQAIEKISCLLTKGEEFKATMYSILVRLARQTGMKRGMISLYRQDLEEIYVDITYGIPKRESPIYYRLGEKITGQVMVSGRQNEMNLQEVEQKVRSIMRV